MVIHHHPVEIRAFPFPFQIFGQCLKAKKHNWLTSFWQVSSYKDYIYVENCFNLSQEPMCINCIWGKNMLTTLALKQQHQYISIGNISCVKKDAKQMINKYNTKYKHGKGHTTD